MKIKILTLLLLSFSSAVLAGNCDSYYGTAEDGSSCGLRSHDSRVAPSQQTQSRYGRPHNCLSANDDLVLIGDNRVELIVDKENSSMIVNDHGIATSYLYYAKDVSEQVNKSFYNSMKDGDDINQPHKEISVMTVKGFTRTFYLGVATFGKNASLEKNEMFICD